MRYNIKFPIDLGKVQARTVVGSMTAEFNWIPCPQTKALAAKVGLDIDNQGLTPKTMPAWADAENAIGSATLSAAFIAKYKGRVW